MSVAYGSHMAMRHCLEANMLAQVQRPSGFRSSMFGLQQHLGTYETLSTLDICNNPNDAPDLDKVGQRARLEQKAAMW